MARRSWRAFGESAWLLVICAGLLLPVRVFASPEHTELDLDAMIEQADLVFRGKVVEVAYRDAEPHQDGARGAPHTFVTYAVSKVMKGVAPGPQVTLRFHGGPLDADRFVMAADNPLFDGGDEDVLLVRDNGASVCPLVNCADGRFRLIQDKVYDELGRTLEWTPSHALTRGPTVALPEVTDHRMSATIQLHVEDSDVDPDARPVRESQALADDFASYVSDVGKAAAGAAAAPARAFASADIGQPFADESELEQQARAAALEHDEPAGARQKQPHARVADATAAQRQPSASASASAPPPVAEANPQRGAARSATRHAELALWLIVPASLAGMLLMPLRSRSRSRLKPVERKTR
jgi:hypothetical protein